MIVSSAKLMQAKPRIIDWWQTAYLDAAPPVRLRFAGEAQATLPIQKSAQTKDMTDLEDLFQALDFRRLRLRQETQVPEWLA